MEPNPSQVNPVHISTRYMFMIHFVIQIRTVHVIFQALRPGANLRTVTFDYGTNGKTEEIGEKFSYITLSTAYYHRTGSGPP